MVNSANNSKIQSEVTGWRDISSELTQNPAYTVVLKINPLIHKATLSYVRATWPVDKGSKSTSNINIPETYRPRARLMSPVGANTLIYVDVNGSVVLDNVPSTSNYSGGVNRQWDYYYGE